MGNTTSSGRIAPWAQAGPAAFFLQDVGHTLLLLQESPWFGTDPSLTQDRERVKTLSALDDKALTWLLGQQNALKADTSLNRQGQPMGTCLLPQRSRPPAPGGTQCWRIANSRCAPNISARTAHPPELGGFDSSYQAVSIYICEIVYLQANPHDIDLRNALWSAIQRGMAREAANLEPTGRVSTEGKTHASAVRTRTDGSI